MKEKKRTRERTHEEWMRKRQKINGWRGEKNKRMGEGIMDNGEREHG